MFITPYCLLQRCDTDGVSHTRCAIVEHTATMRVQNYAGSRVKLWQLVKVLLMLTRDLFALFTTVLDKISTDIAVRRAGLWAIAELLA